ncbi:Anaerobic glycerol-3-phosphate dehydrogenase subunit C [subsurface metagenome]
MENREPEHLAREVIETCVSCDFCNFIMDDTPCLVFPDLQRLYQKERSKVEKLTSYELRHFVDLCNECGICPCNIIRSGIREAKNAFIRRDGLRLSTRLLERVELVGRISGVFPAFSNSLSRKSLTSKAIKRTLGIHQRRRLPTVPEENFIKWLARNGRHFRPDGARRKVAYFVGCGGRYLFPNVPKAAVKVLTHNNVEVLVPEQKCCGMPPLLEGDRTLTLRLVAENVERLYEAVENDWDIVCSCPTCGYMLKELLKDEDYFAPIDRRKRIQIASRTFDLGEYLVRLHKQGELKTKFAPMPVATVYYPPCHLRAQKIGEPYVTLLKGIPQLKIKKIEGDSYCCGVAGIMGFKREFHDASIEMGQGLMQYIQELNPERILTDCFGCQLQFRQLLPYLVWHPVEMLEQAYGA